MRSDHRPPWLLLAALPGFLLGPAPASGAAVAMSLCGGGSVSLPTGGKQTPGGDNPACHAACLSRRSDEDGDTP